MQYWFQHLVMFSLLFHCCITLVMLVPLDSEDTNIPSSSSLSSQKEQKLLEPFLVSSQLTSSSSQTNQNSKTQQRDYSYDAASSLSSSKSSNSLESLFRPPRSVSEEDQQLQRRKRGGYPCSCHRQRHMEHREKMKYKLANFPDCVNFYNELSSVRSQLTEYLDSSYTPLGRHRINSEMLVRSIFNSLDHNQNGVISVDELREYLVLVDVISYSEPYQDSRTKT